MISDGEELENQIVSILAKIGIQCVHPLKQARYVDIATTGSYSGNEHLEFDFFYPIGTVCVVVEIKGTSNPQTLQSEYNTFRNHYNWLRSQTIDDNLWARLGVPGTRIRDFRYMRGFRGIFISPYLHKLDANLSNVPNIAVCYKADWNLIHEYAEML